MVRGAVRARGEKALTAYFFIAWFCVGSQCSKPIIIEMPNHTACVLEKRSALEHGAAGAVCLAKTGKGDAPKD